MFSWIRRLTAAKMSIIPKSVYRSIAITIRFSIAVFRGKKKTMLIILWNHKGIFKDSLEKEKQCFKPQSS